LPASVKLALRQWAASDHFRRRCRERAIAKGLVAIGLDLADLWCPEEDGRMRLGFSRRAIRRAEHDPQLMGYAERFERLVLVVARDDTVITAWRGRQRRCRARGEREGVDARNWGEG
jgi:hypothetical protein